MRLTIFVLMVAAILLAGCNFGTGDMVVNAGGAQNAATENAMMEGSSASDGGTDILGGEADVDASPLSSPSESASESGD